MQSDFNLAKVHFELGLEAISQGNYIEAEKQLLQANVLAPKRPSILTNLSAVFISLQNWQAAESLCKELLMIEPENAECLINLGMCDIHSNNSEGALVKFNRAIEIAPQALSAWINKGNILQELGNFDEAKVCLKKALELNPKSEEALIGMGNLHNELKEYEEGIKCFSKVLAINPQNAQAEWNKALSILRLGDFEGGWRLYEARWRVRGMAEHARYQDIPLWLGDLPLNQKNILIHDEQGFGDTIQMARYLPLLEKQMGAQVFFAVQSPLIELMKTLSPSITIIDSRKPVAQQISQKMDYQCPVMSLPLAFKTTLSSIPQNTPYLFVDENKRLFWQKRLNEISPKTVLSKTKLRVGITWSGSGHYAGKKSSKRDLPFEQVNALVKSMACEAIDFHAIQKDLRIDCLKDTPENLFFHGDHLNNFADSAALLAELDLAISVDTAVGHLAGAIGKDVLLLIPDPPDFMAMVDINNSPWYPKTQLIRQNKCGVWLIEHIKDVILQFK